MPGYIPHGMCLLWEPWLLWLTVAADLVIGASYMLAISPVLVLLRRREYGALRWFFYWFAAFIALCGLTHFDDVLNVWVPAYWYAMVVKVCTALVSATTAGLLIRHRRAIADYPTPAELAMKNERLQHDADALRKAMTVLGTEYAIKAKHLEGIASIVSRLEALSERAS